MFQVDRIVTDIVWARSVSRVLQVDRIAWYTNYVNKKLCLDCFRSITLLQQLFKQVTAYLHVYVCLCLSLFVSICFYLSLFVPAVIEHMRLWYLLLSLVVSICLYLSLFVSICFCCLCFTQIIYVYMFRFVCRCLWCFGSITLLHKVCKQEAVSRVFQVDHTFTTIM